jgi:hypothetical protein
MTRKPKDVLEQARSSFRTGKHAEALEQYEYFFDHALEDIEHNFYGVRLSYCLDEWATLGQIYPPAKERLEWKRDEALSLLMQTRKPERFHDFISICGYLKCDNLPVEKFLFLHASDPDLAKSVFNFIGDALVEAKQWEVYAAYISSPFEEYQRYLELLDRMLEIHQQEGWDVSRVKRRFVRSISNLLLVLKHTGKGSDIASLQNAVTNDTESRCLPELAEDINWRAALRNPSDT